MKAPSTIEQLKAILALPFIVIVVIPLLIGFLSPDIRFKSIYHEFQTISYSLGVIFLLIGAPLFIQAIRLVNKIGKGTLAPWNPTRKLVVKSLYRHLRNPMISGVFLIILAESFLFKSFNLLVWSLIFLVANHIFIILKEEPDLIKRFGEEYKEYMENVPRWIPRLIGWKPELENK